MWTFRFNRQSFDRHQGLDPRRWPTEAEAIAAAFAWQDDNTTYSVEPVLAPDAPNTDNTEENTMAHQAETIGSAIERRRIDREAAEASGTWTPRTDNAKYHVLAYYAYTEGRIAFTGRSAFQRFQWPLNPYNPRSPMAAAWDAGFADAYERQVDRTGATGSAENDPLPDGVTMIGHWPE